MVFEGVLLFKLYYVSVTFVLDRYLSGTNGWDFEVRVRGEMADV